MRISAPGKLFLTGEYAVLWGAPATLAAVNPGLSAHFEPRAAGELELRVPGGTSRGAAVDGAIRWTGPQPPSRFVRRAIELALADGEVPGFMLRFEAGARGPRNKKLGLGSSASASVIGAAAALHARAPREPLDLDRVFAVAARAHWETQERRGSNGDVAAACHGGLIRYLRYPVELEAPGRPEIEPLPSSGLELALVFSGRSAQTPSMVSAVEAALSPADRADFAARSSALTRAFCSALAQARHAPAIEALNASGDLLHELGQRAGVAVVTPRLAKIQELGRAHGLAAKVSGAGGGDGALLASFDPRALRAATDELRRQGLETLELKLARGVQIVR